MFFGWHRITFFTSFVKFIPKCFIIFGREPWSEGLWPLFYYFPCFYKWNCFLNFVFALLPVYRNNINSYILILYPENLLNSDINSSNFCYYRCLRIFYTWDHLQIKTVFLLSFNLFAKYLLLNLKFYKIFKNRVGEGPREDNVKMEEAGLANWGWGSRRDQEPLQWVRLTSSFSGCWNEGSAMRKACSG